MNKLPTKQIYLLIVIIVGIFALSLYSTYAIFTFESETSDAFSIQLPSVLEIKTDMYEYKQIKIPANSVQTTDVDLYNTYDYDLCYSVWYKVLGEDKDLVDIYEISDENLNTNGIILPLSKIRFPLLITNNSDSDIKINVGLAAVKNTDTCSLKLSNDKKYIKQIYSSEVLWLKEEIISKSEAQRNDLEPGSIIYKNKTVDLSYQKSIIIANEYAIKDGKYTLLNPQKISSEEYYNNLENIDYKQNNYFTCSNESCDTLYKINEATVSIYLSEDEQQLFNYSVTNVDEYEAYNQGISGIRKDNNNYYYYGDNPHNYIYYNCQDNKLDNCELWRIIGLIYDEEKEKYNLKIIRNDSIGEYQYNENITSNVWSDQDKKATLYKYLTEEYQINDKYLNIYHHNFEEITDLNIELKDIPNTKILPKEKEVTLMNLTDYINASTCNNGTIDSYTNCLNNNWLNRITIPNEWTLTSHKDLVIETIPVPEQTEDVLPQEETDNEEEFSEEQPLETPLEELKPIIIEKYMYTVGNKITIKKVTEKLAVRPVAYITENILLYSGDGTIDNPYVIK